MSGLNNASSKMNGLSKTPLIFLIDLMIGKLSTTGKSSTSGKLPYLMIETSIGLISLIVRQRIEKILPTRKY